MRGRRGVAIARGREARGSDPSWGVGVGWLLLAGERQEGATRHIYMWVRSEDVALNS